MLGIPDNAEAKPREELHQLRNHTKIPYFNLNDHNCSTFNGVVLKRGVHKNLAKLKWDCLEKSSTWIMDRDVAQVSYNSYVLQWLLFPPGDNNIHQKSICGGLFGAAVRSCRWNVKRMCVRVYTWILLYFVL